MSTKTRPRVDIRQELMRATNLFGPLAEQPELCARLQAVIDKPTEETWEDAHSLIVGRNMRMTLWQAVLEVARAFPGTGPITGMDGHRGPWPQFPTQELLLSALRWATMAEIVLPTNLKNWPVQQWAYESDGRCRWFLPGGYMVDREPKYMRSISGTYTAHLSGASESGNALTIGKATSLTGILDVVRQDFEARGQCPRCRQVCAEQDVASLNYRITRNGKPPAYKACPECPRAVSLGHLGS